MFQALDPQKVNTIASAIVTVFQGQGGTINDILDQTGRLTSELADRDEAIGSVVKNLSTVLDSIVAKAGEVDSTVVNLETLISGLTKQADPLADSVASLSNATGALSDLLSENRPLLKSTVTDRPKASCSPSSTRAHSWTTCCTSCRPRSRCWVAAQAPTATSSTSTCATSRSR